MPSKNRPPKLALALPALAVLTFAACGGDDGPDATAGGQPTALPTTSAADLPALDPSQVRVYTSAEVCALVSPDAASDALGVEVTAAKPSELSTPQCSYDFSTPEGTRTNLTLAVQRPVEDLGGRAGKAGYEMTTSLVIFGVAYEPLAGVGDEAAVSASESLTIVAVLSGDQVFTMATSVEIDVARLVDFGNLVVEAL